MCLFSHVRMRSISSSRDKSISSTAAARSRYHALLPVRSTREMEVLRITACARASMYSPYAVSLLLACCIASNLSSSPRYGIALLRSATYCARAASPPTSSAAVYFWNNLRVTCRSRSLCAYGRSAALNMACSFGIHFCNVTNKS